MRGTGAALRRSGVAPISCTDAPAAWTDATISRSGHPGGERGRLGDREKRRLRRGSYDQNQMQAVLDKTDELINALRR